MNRHRSIVHSPASFSLPMRLLAALLALCCLDTLAWTPPANPDPQAILREASDDRVAKRYEDALAKHVWFHRNALAFESSMSGVRLSFALADWRVLAGRYEPAMAALRAERDAATIRVREGVRIRDSFGDAAALNGVLDDEAATHALFLDVEARDAAIARSMYRLAEVALIEARDFARCGKYLDADSMLTSAIRMREDTRALGGGNAESRRRFDEMSEARLVHDAAKVVALLVLSGRASEAPAIVSRARAALDTPAMNKALQEAMAGRLPVQSPSKAELRAMRDARP